MKALGKTTLPRLTTEAKKNRHRCRLSNVLEQPLSLGKLRTTSRLAQAYLLSFHFSGVSRDEPGRAKCASQTLVII